METQFTFQIGQIWCRLNLVTYEAILDQSERTNVYNLLSNYTKP